MLSIDKITIYHKQDDLISPLVLIDSTPNYTCLFFVLYGVTSIFSIPPSFSYPIGIRNNSGIKLAK